MDILKKIDIQQDGHSFNVLFFSENTIGASENKSEFWGAPFIEKLKAEVESFSFDKTGFSYDEIMLIEKWAIKNYDRICTILSEELNDIDNY